MNEQSMRILLIEDNPVDARLVSEYLRESNGHRFKVIHADRLTAGVEIIAREALDLILLDLNLPDSQGLKTFQKVQAQTAKVPVIVLTGNADENLGEEAVKRGAQDFLVKGSVDGPLLVRAMRYAMERQRLLTSLAQARQQQEMERNSRFFEQLSRASATTVTAQSLGLTTLREGQPQVFDDSVHYYRDLLELAVERQVYKVDADISSRLLHLAERLSFLNAGPRDVVVIHNTSMQMVSKRHPYPKNLAYQEEGRFLVLEFMGCLVSCYRNYAMGFSMLKTPRLEEESRVEHQVKE